MSQLLNIGLALQRDYQKWLSVSAESGLNVYGSTFEQGHAAMTVLTEEAFITLYEKERGLMELFSKVFLPLEPVPWPEETNPNTAIEPDMLGKSGLFVDRPSTAAVELGEQNKRRTSPFLGKQTTGAIQDKVAYETTRVPTAQNHTVAAVNQAPPHYAKPVSVFSNSDKAKDWESKETSPLTGAGFDGPEAKVAPHPTQTGIMPSTTPTSPQNKSKQATAPGAVPSYTETDKDFAPLNRLSHFAERFAGWASPNPMPPSPKTDHEIDMQQIKTGIGPLSKDASPKPDHGSNYWYDPYIDNTTGVGPFPKNLPNPYREALGHTSTVPEKPLTPINPNKTTDPAPESQIPENRLDPDMDVDDLMEVFAHRLEQAFHRFYG